MSWEGFKIALNKCRNKIILIQAMIAYFVKEEIISVDAKTPEGVEKSEEEKAKEEEDDFYVSKGQDKFFLQNFF